MYYDRFISNGYSHMNRFLNMRSSEHDEVYKDLVLLLLFFVTQLIIGNNTSLLLGLYHQN